MRPHTKLRPARGRAVAALMTVPIVAGAPFAAAAAAAVGSPAPAPIDSRVVVTSRHLQVLAGHSITVTGFVAPKAAGHLVRLERRAGHAWRPIAATRTRATGAYRLRYHAAHAGSVAVRLSLAGDRTAAPAQRGLGRLTAYRATRASRYDLYGGALACGGRLGYDSLVVAHKSLPCGTPVTVRYHGRVVHARVADRGPYAGGREFDLAGAVARRLGFNGVGTIWVTA